MNFPFSPSVVAPFGITLPPPSGEGWGEGVWNIPSIPASFKNFAASIRTGSP